MSGPRAGAILAPPLVAAVLGASGCGGAATSTTVNARPAHCQALVTQTLGEVATRAYTQVQRGRDVQFVLGLLAHDTALGDAIAHGDAGVIAARAATVGHGHYTRLEISRNGQALAVEGRGPGLAPVRGPIRDRSGRVVATATIARLRNSDYSQLAAHLTDAQIRVDVPGRPADSRFARAPSHSTAVASTYTLRGEAFPGGPATVTLRIAPADSLCDLDPAATRANVIAGVAGRIYGSEAHSLAVTETVNAIAAYRPLIDAVAGNDARATAAAVRALVFDHSHIVRLRVMRGPRLLSDVGGPDVLAPSPGVLRDSSGAVVGRFVTSIQDDLGFRLLTQRFTATHTVLLIGNRIVQGAVRGAPSPLPSSGPITIRGTRYHLVSFPAEEFPSGPLRVTLMVRPAA